MFGRKGCEWRTNGYSPCSVHGICVTAMLNHADDSQGVQYLKADMELQQGQALMDIMRVRRGTPVTVVEGVNSTIYQLTYTGSDLCYWQREQIKKYQCHHRNQ